METTRSPCPVPAGCHSELAPSGVSHTGQLLPTAARTTGTQQRGFKAPQLHLVLVVLLARLRFFVLNPLGRKIK